MPLLVNPFKNRLRAALATLGFAAGLQRALGQYAYYDMVQPELRAPRLRYIKMDVEADQSSYSTRLGGKLDSQRLALTPGLGIGWDYFLYHPALLSFSFLAEPGYTWQHYENNTTSQQSDATLLNGNFTGLLLREKPYAVKLNYARAHDDFHYDFFSSATVDSETYGLSSGYREGPVPVRLAFQQTHVENAGFSQNTISDQSVLDLQARSERKKQDATDLTYQFSLLNYDTQYKRVSFDTENSYHHVSLTDSEHFEKSILTSALRYYDISSTRSSSSDLNLALSFGVEHAPHLHSFYNYSFADHSGNGSDAVQHYGMAGLQHQLYESLASSLNVHGAILNSTFGASSVDSLAAGAGGSLGYTKRLGAWGRLSMGNSLGYDVTDQKVTGSELFISDESYTVPATGPMIIRLRSPREISVSSVKKNNIELSPGEYAVLKTTDPWQLQFFSAGPNNVQPGDTVMVSYTLRSNPSGSFAVFSDNAHISVRFWQDRAEIYARYSFTDNHADSSDFLLQNIQQFEAGANVEWRGLRLQGGYTDLHSTLFDYQSLTLSEGYSMAVSEHSTIGIDLSQQWNMYPPGSGTSTNQAQTTSFYNFMAHYEWHPTGALSWRAEVGYQQQRGSGYDQNLFAARTYLNWMVGKLEMHLGYEHENQKYTAESRARDFAFLRMRRNF